MVVQNTLKAPNRQAWVKARRRSTGQRAQKGTRQETARQKSRARQSCREENSACQSWTGQSSIGQSSQACGQKDGRSGIGSLPARPVRRWQAARAICQPNPRDNPTNDRTSSVSAKENRYPAPARRRLLAWRARADRAGWPCSRHSRAPFSGGTGSQLAGNRALARPLAGHLAVDQPDCRRFFLAYPVKTYTH